VELHVPKSSGGFEAAWSLIIMQQSMVRVSIELGSAQSDRTDSRAGSWE
jgi:hypothetical protein